MNSIAFIVLFALSLVGFAIGLLYYFKPDQMVARRIKAEHRELAEQDPEFRHWLEREIETQVRRTRKIGLMMIVLEVVYVAIILTLLQGNYFKLK
ncbi:MAG: hypothetical protein ACOY4Q_07135 [Bacillota bacterium]